MEEVVLVLLMFKMMAWNIRGLNAPLKQKEIRRYVKLHKLAVFSISETKVRWSNVDWMFKRCFSDWNIIHSGSASSVCRLWVCWDPMIVQLNPFQISDQAISASLKVLNSSVEFYVSFIYGSNDYLVRRQLWSQLRGLVGAFGQTPWILLGDFNVVRSHEEKTGGRGIDSGEVEEFNSCLYNVGVDDLNGKGRWLTWDNQRDGNDNIQSKLDRVLVNNEWMQKFPNSECFYDSPGVSDHCPILCTIDTKWKLKRGPFRFYTYWMQHREFAQILHNSWTEPVSGNPMLRVSLKLKRLKVELKLFDKKFYSRISQRTCEAREKMNNIQDLVGMYPQDQRLRVEEKKLKSEYLELSLAEEAYYKQKARVRWLALGDRNTSFFHKKVNGNRARNRILSIMDCNGTKLEDADAVQKEAVSFFQGLLGSNVVCVVDEEKLARCVQYKLNDTQTVALDRLPTNQEIKEAMFEMAGDKAPGPDGYNAYFFQHNWGLVGEEVCRGILHFFQTNILQSEWNNTAITLIPKCKNPTTMRDFRPISCCNTLYKCIAKILANRMKPLLPHLVSKHQAAFVKGRCISDNILLMEGLLRNYHRNDSPAKCAIKVDIMKAYDSVSWDFLMGILKVMNFPQSFIRWIGECISTTKFSIMLNGSLEGYFQGKKGIRQGDPMSPYLFLLAMEVFGGMLKKNIREGSFTYHPKCKQLGISHLAFADDLFILAAADVNSIRIVKDTLKEFEIDSGLKPNLSKSEVFFSGVTAATKRNLKDILGMVEGNLPVRYLGVPLISSRLKAEDCKALVDSITKKASHWTSKFLSYAGRLQLVSSVLYSVQIYWSSIFVLPKSVLKSIERVMRNYLWSGVEMKSTKAKVAWKDICKPKKEGGLGLKDLAEWNRAVMTKQIWDLCSKKDTLWIKWCHQVYVKGRCFWGLKVPRDCCWGWRKLLKLRYCAWQMVKYYIGNGKHTFLWYDNWHPFGPLVTKFGNAIIGECGSSETAKVSSVIRNNRWRWPSGNSAAITALKDNTPTSLLSDAHGQDYVKWELSVDGIYHSSDAWNRIRSTSSLVNWYDIVWFKECVPRFSFIVWMVCKRCLSTKDKLKEWGVITLDTCVLCGNQSETLDHLFFSCSVSSQIWKNFLNMAAYSHAVGSWESELRWAIDHLKGKSFKTSLVKLAFSAVVYYIWQERNQRVFTGRKRDSETLVNVIQNAIFNATLSWRGIPKSFNNWMLSLSFGLADSIFLRLKHIVSL
uniref:Reverse transcriptase domain-containing protein n=1 Tax=Davidia involucrata TaxID=16924 RepID=A0A5B6YUZ1_DAVIN